MLTKSRISSAAVCTVSDSRIIPDQRYKPHLLVVIFMPKSVFHLFAVCVGVDVVGVVDVVVSVVISYFPVLHSA